MLALYALGFMGGIGGLLFSLTFSFKNYLWLFVIVALLVSGQLQYFAGIDKSPWLVYVLGGWLYVKIIMHVVSVDRLFFSVNAIRNSVSIVFFLFFVVILISQLINWPPFLQVALSIKHYIFLWSISFVFLSGLVSDRFYISFWPKLLWIAPLQLPVVMYQRFVIAPERNSFGEWDSIVGLFGGNPDGGGASGAMALFLVFLILLALSYWRNNLISSKYFFVIVCCSFLSIGMAEVKYALFLLPLSAIFLYKKQLFTKPLMAVVVVVVVVALSILILYIYRLQFSYGMTSLAMDEYALQLFIGTAMEVDFVNETGEMGRVAALYLWWNSFDSNNYLQYLFGFGVGAVRDTNIFVGEIARDYPFILARSTMVVYLWELGIIGFFLLVALLVSASIMAGRLSKQYNTPNGSAELEVISVFLVIVLFALPYNTDMVYVPAFQLVVAFLVGHVFAARYAVRDYRIASEE